MRGRDTTESHRASTPLELLFDLTFVVAVSQAVGQLAHAVVEGHAATGVVGYLMVFFAIWWAWMNFTWFASAFDTDDVPYRLLTMVQMAGVLVLAAAVPAAFEDADFTWITIGYVIMRVAMVAQWVRVAVSEPQWRTTATRFAVGISIVQVLWLLRLALPEQLLGWAFALLVLAELAVPLWAERARATPWHPHHIAERYQLFVIIVLGESVFGSTVAVQTSLDEGGLTLDLALTAVAGLVVLFGLWWLYFLRPGAVVRDPASGFVWGYAHYVVFAGMAAVGGGIEVAAEAAGHHLEIGHLSVTLALALPLAIVLAVVGWLHHRAGSISPPPAAWVLAVLGTVALALLGNALSLPVTLLLVCVPLVALVVWGVRADAVAGALRS